MMKAVAAAWLAAAVVCAQAQDWPTQPLRMLVGSSPGGGTDAMARAIADKLGAVLKTTVVVENRAGASNTLAAAATVAAADRHTVLMGVSTAQAIAPYLMKLPYDNERDLVPVAFVAAVPNVLVVNNGLGVTTVSGLVELAKKQPGKLNFASSGAGSTQHIAAELFKDATGTYILHIPYRGSGPALVDLMAGQVQMSFDTLAAVLPQVRAGKVRALAVASARRSAQLPQVPTMAEAGVKGVEMSAWYGLYMPAATPKPVQDRVHDEVNRLLQQSDVRSRIESLGGEITPMTQAQFKAFHDAENRRYAAIVRKRGIKQD